MNDMDFFLLRPTPDPVMLVRTHLRGTISILICGTRTEQAITVSAWFLSSRPVFTLVGQYRLEVHWLQQHCPPWTLPHPLIVQELCESRGGRPGRSVLTSLLVSVDVKLYWAMLRHWSQLVPNMSTDIWGHQATLPTYPTPACKAFPVRNVHPNSPANSVFSCPRTIPLSILCVLMIFLSQTNAKKKRKSLFKFCTFIGRFALLLVVFKWRHWQWKVKHSCFVVRRPGH